MSMAVSAPGATAVTRYHKHSRRLWVLCTCTRDCRFKLQKTCMIQIAKESEKTTSKNRKCVCCCSFHCLFLAWRAGWLANQPTMANQLASQPSPPKPTSQPASHGGPWPDICGFGMPKPCLQDVSKIVLRCLMSDPYLACLARLACMACLDCSACLACSVCLVCSACLACLAGW